MPRIARATAEMARVSGRVGVVDRSAVISASIVRATANTEVQIIERRNRRMLTMFCLLSFVFFGWVIWISYAK